MKHFIIAASVLLMFVFSPMAFAGDLVSESFSEGVISFSHEVDGVDVYTFACVGGTAYHCRTTEIWVNSATNDRSRGIEVVEHNQYDETYWQIRIGGSTVDTLPSDHFVEIPYFFSEYYTVTEISFRYLNYRADNSGQPYVIIGAADADGNVIWENSKKIKKWNTAYFGYQSWVVPYLNEAAVQAITGGKPFNFVKIIERDITSAEGNSYIDGIRIHGLIPSAPEVVDEMLDSFVPEPTTTETCPEPEIVEVIKEVEVIEYVEVIKYVEVIEYVYIDRDNGHGNDVDGFDESNPGRSGGTKKK